MQAWLWIGVACLFDYLRNSLIGPFFIIDFRGSAESNKGMNKQSNKGMNNRRVQNEHESVQEFFDELWHLGK